jgi:hypothetical protein
VNTDSQEIRVDQYLKMHVHRATVRNSFPVLFKFMIFCMFVLLQGLLHAFLVWMEPLLQVGDQLCVLSASKDLPVLLVATLAAKTAPPVAVVAVAELASAKKLRQVRSSLWMTRALG